MSDASVVGRLAELVRGGAVDNLPGEVKWEAGRRVLDTLGCAIAGAHEPEVLQVRSGVMALDGSPVSTIIGSTVRVSADKAALVNCAALRELDYMDGHYGPYPAHASFNIPPILAVAEQLDCTGTDIVLAIALAYEVMIRLQLAAGDPTISQYGWSGSTNLGISTAVGVGTLLGLSVEQMAHAIAIAATHAPALNASSHGQMPGSTCCMDGMVAAAAIQATFMAQAGLTGPREVFEGEGGYRQAVAHRLDTDILLAPLDRHRILDVYTMRYNGVKCGQTAAAAGLELVAALPNGWRDVEHLTLGLASAEYRHQRQDEPSRRRPSSRLTAVHSAIYCLAAALVDGDLGPPQFASDKRTSPDILALIDRIDLKLRSDLDEHYPACSPAHIAIEARGGQRSSKHLLYAPGHPKNRLSDDDLRAKFRRISAGNLAPERIGEVIDMATSLNEARSIRQLMGLLAS